MNETRNADKKTKFKSIPGAIENVLQQTVRILRGIIMAMLFVTKRKDSVSKETERVIHRSDDMGLGETLTDPSHPHYLKPIK